jgi:glycerol uptake facilitator-like aquaporin
MTMSRRLAAELVGTALLLMAVVGSGIMAEDLAGGNVAIALLANTVATGAALVALIHTFGPVSGAHFNPAVTLALTLTGHFDRRAVAPYGAAQIVGAIAGVWLAHLMFDMAILQSATKVRTGTGQWAGEIVATFALVTVILAGVRQRSTALPWSVALTVVAAYWFTSSTSFANPAVTLARALSDSFAGIRPADAPGFLLAQFAGMALAALFARWLTPAVKTPG